MRSPAESTLRTVRCALVLAFGLLQLPDVAKAEVRRALLVGINNYEAAGRAGTPAGTGDRDRGWINLEGSQNDIEGMRALLVGRYGFEPKNVVVLRESAATRNAILKSIRAHLLAPAKQGDVCVFYFAGHGSQVVNANSPEADKLDETIVPADRQDIRDKEIAALFNDILDRGALVTAFFDCCHSGSISRGLGSPPRWRGLRPGQSPGPSPDPDPRGLPVDRGALVFSASQEAQKAAEIADAEGQPHGVFSLMLVKALRTAPAGEPAGRIAARVRALVATSEAGQSPAIAGSAGRLAAPLFGGKTTKANEQLLLPFVGSRQNRWWIEGGSAAGLYPGCELVPASTGVAGTPAVAVPRLRVESVQGPDRSTVQCVQGDIGKLTPGQLLQVDRWVAPPEARLRFWTPPPIDAVVLQRAVTEFGTLAQDPTLHWVDDPTEQTPTHIVSWAGTSWVVTGPGNRAVQVTSAANVLEVLKQERAPKSVPALFVLLPPPAPLTPVLPAPGHDAELRVQSVGTESEAQYLLAGRIEKGAAEYAWVARNATRPDLDGLTSMPACTDWFPVPGAAAAAGAVADSLQDHAFRLAKVHGWLLLDSPPGVVRFPYHLAIRGAGGAALQPGSVVRDGDPISISLEAPARDAELGSGRFYVYVFTIDREGKSTLLFGREGSGNPLPTAAMLKDGIPPARIPLDSTITVSRPFGTDTYVMLISKEPVADAERVLAFDGVREPSRTRSAAESTSSLDALLGNLGSPTRGARVSTPATWAVERVAILSRP